ncbi:hypothetical protein DENSPDRAFT_875616 [Dentipellis sp. KUC8613]|nr:hypothetical protein DENSPDRAFT_875616 [Dentipellis sp. KUC8613]
MEVDEINGILVGPTNTEAAPADGTADATTGPVTPSTTLPAPTTASEDATPADAPKYYLIDFGLADRFDPRKGPWPPSSVKTHGADRTAPELGYFLDEPYDPFPTDVYYLGNLIRTDFLQRYRNLEFMEPLVRKMIDSDPCCRPTIHDALSEFKTLGRSLPSLRFRLRLVGRGDNLAVSVWQTGKYLAHSAQWIFNRLPAVPSGA